MSDYTLRNLTQADVPACVELSHAAGWAQSAAAWDRVLAWGKDGCFAFTDGETLVATAVGTCYGIKRAWISMVLTHPDYRRQGLARQLVEKTLAFVKARGITEIGLDATEEGVPLYEQAGFQRVEDIGIWWGKAGEHDRLRVAPLTFSILPRVIKFDEEIFGVSRASFFTRQLEEFPDMVWIDREAKEISGLICGQEQNDGRIHLGPWQHQTAEGAEKLLGHALTIIDSERVFIQIPDSNSAAKSIAEKHAFSLDQSFTRMYHGDASTAPKTDGRYYGIGGFTIG